MYPYGSLPSNLAAFCDRLRGRHGFRVGPRELADAARMLTLMPLDDERRVRDALRPILSHTPGEALEFDRAFDTFFHSPGLTRGIEPQASAPSDQQRLRRGGKRASVAAPGHQGEQVDGLDAIGRIETGDDNEPDASEPTLARVTYSPLEGEGRAPGLDPPDAEWCDAGRAFVRSLRAGLSRRWQPASHGRLFDLRRTLRGSLHTGGEAVVPRWRTRERRRPEVVWLVDASRSMGEQAATALHCAVATASATTAIETFVFSTALERVTDSVRRAAAGECVQLSPLDTAWGGGTSIGKCLARFIQRFGARLLCPNAVLVVASDGLDVGEPALLRETMARLHRRSAGIIWLNPLLETPGYEPSARGMQAARPSVDTLASVKDAEGLLSLARTVRLRS